MRNKKGNLGIASCLWLELLESGLQDSNLQPSASKAQEVFLKRFVRTIAVIGNLSDHGSFLRHKKVA